MILTFDKKKRVNISEESEIAEEELTVLTHLKQLKVLSINSEGCDKEEIFQNLERLSPPPHLEELYLRHYRGGLTPHHSVICNIFAWKMETSSPQVLSLRALMAPLGRLWVYV